MKKKPQTLHLTLLVCSRLFTFFAVGLATFISINIFKNTGIFHYSLIAIAISICILTLVIFLFGELIPKSLFTKKPETISLIFAKFIYIITLIFFPVLRLISITYKIFTKNYSIYEKPALTEEDIKDIIEVGQSQNSIDKEEKELIKNVFELDKTEAKEIMTPRTDMFCLDFNNRIKDVIDEIIEKNFSRIPVYDKKVDRIKGIVYIKDIMAQLVKGKDDIKLKEIMKPAIYVPENKIINSLLSQFKKEKVHLALVVDEYGGIEGLITIEDVLEELVGEIYDETDEPEKLIKKIDEKSAKVLGKVSIEDVNEELNLQLEENDAYETISGFILYKLGRIPAEGDSLTLNNIKIKITRVIENRIKEIEITKT